jgi:hypothetical protein
MQMFDGQCKRCVHKYILYVFVINWSYRAFYFYSLRISLLFNLYTMVTVDDKRIFIHSLYSSDAVSLCNE